MFDIRLREVKDRLFDPLVQLVPLAAKPEHLTATGFAFGVSACVTTAIPQIAHLAVYLWLANRFFDCLDGVTARHRGIASDLGGFYDLLSDFIVYSAIPIAVGYGQAMDSQRDEVDVSRWLAISFVEATFHINNFVLFYCAAVAANRQKDELTSVTMKPALIEGFESGLFFSAMLIWPHHIGVLCWVMGSLVLLGVLQRFWYVAKILSRSNTVMEKVKK